MYSIWKQGGEAEARRVEKGIAHLPLTILPADREHATAAAELKARHGLGHAGSFAAEYAMGFGKRVEAVGPLIGITAEAVDKHQGWSTADVVIAKFLPEERRAPQLRNCWQDRLRS